MGTCSIYCLTQSLMKKLILTLICIFLLISSFSISYADPCDYSEGASIGNNLDNCLQTTDLVVPGDWLVESSLKNKVVYWTNQLSMLFGLLAVWAIVYGGLMMTISVWEDEKIKKWKDIVKWALLWFLALITAGVLVRIVVELIFSLSS